MMKTQPFSVCVDGSNDQDVGKMYPLTVRIYDVNRSSVVSRFLNICSSQDLVTLWPKVQQ